MEELQVSLYGQLSKNDDDVQEVYHNAEFPEGWDE